MLFVYGTLAHNSPSFILGDNLLRINFFSPSGVLAEAMHCKLGVTIVKTSLAGEITGINQEREGFSFIRKWQFINL